MIQFCDRNMLCPLHLVFPLCIINTRKYIFLSLFLSWWFNVGLVLLGICFSLAMYCIFYLEWYKGIKNYDQEYPAIPPITTAAFIAASCRWSIYINKISVKSFIFSYKYNKKQQQHCFRHQKKSRMNLFLCFSCSLNIALWPVWSIFTPLILFTQFMGLVMFNTLMGWMWLVRTDMSY